MFAGLTASAAIGILGAALQFFVVVLRILSGLDRVSLALQQKLARTAATTESTQAAAKLASFDLQEERVWEAVGNAEAAAAAAAKRARDLRLAAAEETERLRQKRGAIWSSRVFDKEST